MDLGSGARESRVTGLRFFDFRLLPLAIAMQRTANHPGLGLPGFETNELRFFDLKHGGIADVIIFFPLAVTVQRTANGPRFGFASRYVGYGFGSLFTKNEGVDSAKSVGENNSLSSAGCHDKSNESDECELHDDEYSVVLEAEFELLRW